MDAKWLAKASLYELLAQGFRQTTPEFSRVIQSGEFAQALDELARDCGLDSHAIASAIDGIGLTASIVYIKSICLYKTRLPRSGQTEHDFPHRYDFSHTYYFVCFYLLNLLLTHTICFSSVQK